MIDLIFSFLGGSIATGLAVLPYAIRRDRDVTDLIDANEQQAHALAHAAAHAQDADQRLVDAAMRISEDAAVIERLDRLVEAHQAQAAALTDKLRTLSVTHNAANNGSSS